MSRPKTTEELLTYHTVCCDAARIIMSNKNQDYGDFADQSKPDPFANFHTWGALGIAVRMDDKYARIRTWIKRGKFAVQESLRDTVLDLINYCVLLLAYLEEE